MTDNITNTYRGHHQKLEITMCKKHLRYIIWFKVAISKFRLSHVNAYFTESFLVYYSFSDVVSLQYQVLLEANKMHFLDSLLSYKQDKWAFFITPCYFVLIFYYVGNFHNYTRHMNEAHDRRHRYVIMEP